MPHHKVIAQLLIHIRNVASKLGLGFVKVLYKVAEEL